MSNLLTYYHFKLDFQKVDQHSGGKWLIHGTKRHKDNHFKTWDLWNHENLPRHKREFWFVRIVHKTNLCRVCICVHDIQPVTPGIVFYSILF